MMRYIFLQNGSRRWKKKVSP